MSGRRLHGQASAYFSALRAFSFPASALPSLTGSVAALYLHHTLPGFSFSWLNCLLSLAGCLAIHSFSNVINDVFDFRSGLDSNENFGQKNPIVRGAITERHMLWFAAWLFGFAVVCGVFFLWNCGVWILVPVVFGASSAYFYTAPPLKLKYRGFGDVQVMVSFGVAMTLGSYYTQAHTVFGNGLPDAATAVFVIGLSLPQGLLISAILHANNHRDRSSDSRFGAQTLASRLRPETSERLQYALVFGAFFVQATLMLLPETRLPPMTALTVLSLPQAIRVARNIRRNERPSTPAFALLVAEAARLQLAYGAAFVAGLLIDVLLM